MYRYVIFAVLFASVLAEKQKLCPWLFGMHAFDSNKLAGDWNVIASTVDFGKPAKCGRYNFIPNKGGHVVKYSGLLENNEPIELEIISKQYNENVEEMSAMMWSVLKKKDTYIGPYDEVIVTTDYDNYVVFIACRQVFDEKKKDIDRDLKAGILSRNKSLSNDTMTILRNLLEGYDIDSNMLVNVDQTSC